MIYFNEIDPVACATLRHNFPYGVVDEQSIKDVSLGDAADWGTARQSFASGAESQRPSSPNVYGIRHFFAGAGLWEIARLMAGWPDDRPLWTASCPCQPFSNAGLRKGTDDPRHLWPDLFRLVRANRPPTVVGEQVSGKAGYGWFDGVASDMEGEGYSIRALDIPALAVNSPQQRNRLWWVAVARADGGNASAEGIQRGGEQRFLAQNRSDSWAAGNAEPTGPSFWHDSYWLQCADGKARRAKPGLCLLVDGMAGRADLWRLVGNSIVPQLAAEVLASILDDAP